jgi:hypothetical protein
MAGEKKVACIGCKALVSDTDGPTFRYPDAASPGCWKIYCDILVREHGEWRYPPIHRLTVDAYAVQHPGRQTPQTTQSVIVHLISMYLVLERGYDFQRATGAMRGVIEKHKQDFVWLTPPDNRGDITVLDVSKARDLEEHTEMVRQWAWSVWNAWSKYRDTIHQFAPFPASP